MRGPGAGHHTPSPPRTPGRVPWRQPVVWYTLPSFYLAAMEAPGPHDNANSRVVLGSLAVLAGVALNPWIVARVLADDGKIDDPLVLIAILAVNLLCLWTGVRLLKHRSLSAVFLPVKFSVTVVVTMLPGSSSGSGCSCSGSTCSASRR